MKSMLLLLFTLAASAFAQNGLTQEERWQTAVGLHVLEGPVWLDQDTLFIVPMGPTLDLKVPEPIIVCDSCNSLAGHTLISSEGIGSTEEPEQPLPVRWTLPDPEWGPYTKTLPLSVRLAGGLPEQPAVTIPLHVRLAQVVVPSCTGVCVSYSGQGAAALVALTGKRIPGFELVEGTVCSDHPATFGAGRIIQQANTLGIQTLKGSIGSAVVQQTVSLNWHNLVPFLFKEGSIVALDLMSSGLWNVGRKAIFATAIFHEGSDHIPILFGRGSPTPDPFLSSVLDENGQISVSPDRCTGVMFAGVWSKSAVKVTGSVQLMP